MTELSDLWGDWTDYFLALRSRSADRSVERVENEPDECLAPFTPAIPSSAPRDAKALHGRLEKAGWEVFCEVAISRKGTVYFMSGERAGEVRFPSHEFSIWQIRARRVQRGRMVAAVQAVWLQREMPDGKIKSGFDYAKQWDAVTRERYDPENYAELREWLDIIAPVASKRKEKVA